jgi:5'-methylthioadenosine phosphorylase
MSGLGIIGGSGLSEIFSDEKMEKIDVETPFGKPSSSIVKIEINNQITYFLPRHGLGHLISPSNINYRANIYALKKMGVNKIISISAVGSLDEELKPGNFVICDQFIDLTKNRKSTFFDLDHVVHVSMAEPTCKILAERVGKISKQFNDTRLGGTYVVIEGPQFSTKAESEAYRKMGSNVIGMTNMPEAKLARESGICYTTLAMVTDFDSWHPEHDNVTIEMIINTMKSNVSKVQLVIKDLATNDMIQNICSCTCCGDLKNSSLSDLSKVTENTKNLTKIFYE